MLTLPDALGLLSASLPVCMFIYKRKLKHSEEAETCRELKQLRENLEARLDVIERDQRRIAVKLGFDLWGS